MKFAIDIAKGKLDKIVQVKESLLKELEDENKRLMNENYRRQSRIEQLEDQIKNS